VNIKMTWSEIEMACIMGIKRKIHKMYKGSKHRWNLAFGPEEWGYEVMGAIGEAAFAKAHGVWWSGTPGQLETEGDVGGHEVRTTHHKNGCLVMHDSDIKEKPDKQFYLVIVDRDEFPSIRIVGWVYGKEAGRQEYWNEKGGHKRPAYWVPQGDLRPPNGGGE